MNTELLPIPLCNCAEINPGCFLKLIASSPQSLKNCSTLSGFTLNLFMTIRISFLNLCFTSSLFPSDCYSIQFKHFLLSLYFTNLLTGYRDSNPVNNQNKRSGNIIIFIYRKVHYRTLYLNIIHEIFRKLSFFVIIHN
jgi:hypothetical protein